MGNFTIDLNINASGLLEAIAALAAALTATQTPQTVSKTVVAAAAPETKPEPVPESKPEPAAAQAKAETEPEPVIALETVRAKLAALSQAGKQSQVKALITEFGAAKLTDIPAEKYSELLEQAEGL